MRRDSRKGDEMEHIWQDKFERARRECIGRQNAAGASCDWKESILCALHCFADANNAAFND